MGKILDLIERSFKNICLVIDEQKSQINDLKKQVEIHNGLIQNNIRPVNDENKEKLTGARVYLVEYDENSNRNMTLIADFYDLQIRNEMARLFLLKNPAYHFEYRSHLD